MKISGALAVFVKTPGLSPVKTRLAASIGTVLAREFYELSVSATRSIALEAVKQLPGLQVYWAVAEEAGLNSPFWSDFPIVWQGNGDLGPRLHSVYCQLLRRHHFVCFMGADSPHLQKSIINEGILLTAKYLEKKFVIGPSEDGGFYFFGGSKDLPEEAWCQVDYSTEKTASQLENQLLSWGGVEKIEENFDVDTLDDLKRLKETLKQSKNFLSGQKALMGWVDSLEFSKLPS